MQADVLKQLDGRAKLYLCPLFPAPVGAAMQGGALPALGGQLSFAGFRLFVRLDRDMLFDGLFSASLMGAVAAALPEALAAQLAEQSDKLARARPAMALGNKTLSFVRPRIMGVLNVTPDSFSDGGNFVDPIAAIVQARKMLAEGADIIDVGGESTRPGAKPVWEGDEWLRVAPVLQGLMAESVVLSLDTRRASVMRRALALGPVLLNDVSALTYEEESLSVAASSDVPVLLMHAQGDPRTMQNDPSYAHCLLDVYDYLAARLAAVAAAGIAPERVILDPGLGFGKRVVEDNLALMRGVGLFHTLGCPLLIGASRKRFVGALSGEEEASQRLGGSLAAALEAVRMGVQIVRVHDVRETAQAVRFLQATLDSSLTDFAPLQDAFERAG